jgi:hypothetical protein
MKPPTYPIAVVMRRRPAQSRWADWIWEAWSVLAGAAEGGPRKLVDNAAETQWLYPGFELALHRDEIAGFHFNVSAAQPRVFVLWRMEGEQGLPVEVTVSFDEAGRWTDGGHSVDGVAMPPEIFAWVGEYVERNYRPEPEKRVKPRSFQHPKDRV